MKPWERYSAAAPKAGSPSAAGDIARTAPGSAVRGAAGTAMILPNMLNAALAGPQLLGRGIADNVTRALGEEPQPRGELWQPFYGSEDLIQELPEKLRPHDAETIPGKLADFGIQTLSGAATVKGMQKVDPGVTRMMKDVGSGKPPKPKPATADELRAAASDSYAEANAQGGILKGNVRNKFLDDLDDLQPKSREVRELAGDEDFVKIAEKLKQNRDRPMTLQTAKELDEYLGDQIDKYFINGSLKAEGRKLLAVQNKLRDAIEGATEADVFGGAKGGFEALKRGRELWSASARQRDIERIVNRAALSDNPQTALRTGFRTLASNPSRMRGFNEKERELITKAAETGIVTEVMRMFGGRLPSIISLGSGGGAGQTAALQGGSMLARDAATKLQMRRADKVMQSVSDRALKPPVPSAAAPQGDAMTPGVVAATLPEAGRETPQEAPAEGPWMKFKPAQPAKPQASLGIRNNNPGNLRDSGDAWLGMTGTDDRGFVRFDSPEMGLRAMARNLMNQPRLHGLDTVNEIVGKYAPPNENDTNNYAQAVARQLGVSPDARLDLGDRQQLARLMAAMIRMEVGGNPYTPEQLQMAAALAMQNNQQLAMR